MTELRRISIHAPRVGRDVQEERGWFKWANFNPRAPCGARLPPPLQVGAQQGISIHAPRVGRDRFQAVPSAPAWNFNPRAPCGARRSAPGPPAVCQTHFNPRAPCGARLGVRLNRMTPAHISIHAPRVGRDVALIDCRMGCGGFQSTRPVWGATSSTTRPLTRCAISIHAPRVGRDAGQPCGGPAQGISIHAPRVGRDPGAAIHAGHDPAISIHAPRVGRDPLPPLAVVVPGISIHAPRVGRDNRSK